MLTIITIGVTMENNYSSNKKSKTSMKRYENSWYH